MAKETNFINSRIKSFKFAFQGFLYLFRTQANFRIQLFLAILAIFLSILLKLSQFEWIIVLLLIGFVLSAEAVNSSLEILCDKIEKDYNESIKNIKDIAAASVLISSLIAFIVGLVIFLPKIIDQFKSFLK